MRSDLSPHAGRGKSDLVLAARLRARAMGERRIVSGEWRMEIHSLIAIRHSQRPPDEGRRSAERRTSHGRATRFDVATKPCAGAAAAPTLTLPRKRGGNGRGQLASRRSTAALAKANVSTFGSAPDPRFLRPGFNGRYPLSPVSSLPRTAGTGLSAGRSGTQSRPGAVCETARGHRTRCRKSDGIRNAPFTSELNPM
jgi:hypothetical protein